MTRRNAIIAIAAIIIAVAGIGAHADDAAPQGELVAIVMVSPDPEAASFAQALDAALADRFAAAGFGRAVRYGASDTSASSPGEPEDARPDAEIAATAAQDTGARWVAIVGCIMEKKRLVWRVSIYDAIDGALVASDAQGAFAGLSAMPMMEESAGRAVAAAAALRARAVPEPFIDYRLRFLSPDEGALVSFGTGDGARPAGSIADGSLEAPFMAFREGMPVSVSVSRTGYWTKVIVATPGVEATAIRLPALQSIASHSLALSLGSGRLLGLAADYRFQVMPDSVFIRAGDHAWIQGGDGADAGAVLHDELRLGAGAYLFLPRDSRFRLAAGVGMSGIATFLLPANIATKAYFDMSMDAWWLSFEWHWPRWALFFEQRFVYSFGLESGLLNRGWVDGGSGPILMSIGAMIKW